MQLIEISPLIPAAISRLPDLAGNLSFSWHRPTRALFEDLDSALWHQTGGNPRLMLRCVDQRVLENAARDETYLQRYRDAVAIFDSYQSQPLSRDDEPLIAYFCAEYGFHESFPIYSGGLGILAADHCKAASDECLNFVAVGLLYRQGYFTQSVDSDGVQNPEYRDTDPRDLPVEQVRDASGNWLTVTVPIGAREVHAYVWRAQVGRIYVYLLDTNTPQNSAIDRDITFRLYGGDEGRAHPPGDGPGYRRRARAARAGPGAVRLAYQRGPRSLPDPRAAARADGTRPGVSRQASKRWQRNAYSPPTRR